MCPITEQAQHVQGVGVLGRCQPSIHDLARQFGVVAQGGTHLVQLLQTLGLEFGQALRLLWPQGRKPDCQPRHRAMPGLKAQCELAGNEIVITYQAARPQSVCRLASLCLHAQRAA